MAGLSSSIHADERSSVGEMNKRSDMGPRRPEIIFLNTIRVI